MQKSKFSATLAVLAVLAVFTSCSKDGFIEEPFQPDMDNRYRLVELSNRTEYATDNFNDVFKAYLTSYLDVIDMEVEISPASILSALDVFINLNYTKMSLKFNLEGHLSGFKFVKQNFHYRSVKANGDSATFSGSVIYPAPKSGKGHRLDGISLVHQCANCDNNDILSKNSAMFSFRAIFNQAVVFSDTEGFGVDYGNCPPYFDGFSKGRQYIDAAIAAMQVLKQENITFTRTCFTENIGVSLGGNAALGTQKYLESTQCPSWVEREILPNFSTFASDCPTSIKGIFNQYLIDDILTFPCVVPMMVSTMFAINPSTRGECQFEDYFDSHINDHMIPNSNGEYVGDLEAFTQTLLPSINVYTYFTEYGGNMKLFMNHDLFDPVGRLDMSNRLSQMLSLNLDRLDIADNWSPSHPLFWIHSPEDNVIPFGTAYDTYQQFRKKRGNVLFMPSTGSHVSSSCIDLIYVCLSERPSQGKLSTYLKNANITDFILELNSLLGK